MEGQKRSGMLAALAGVGMVAVGFLTWYELSDSSSSETIKGLDTSAGLGVLAFGVVALVAGLVLFARGPASGGKASSWVITVVSVLAFIAAAYTAFAPEQALVSFEASSVAETYGISDNQAEAILELAIEQGDLEAKAGLGAFLALAPTLLGSIAGIQGIKNAKRRGAEAAVAAAPAAAPPTEPAAP